MLSDMYLSCPGCSPVCLLFAKEEQEKYVVGIIVMNHIAFVKISA